MLSKHLRGLFGASKAGLDAEHRVNRRRSSKRRGSNEASQMPTCVLGTTKLSLGCRQMASGPCPLLAFG